MFGEEVGEEVAREKEYLPFADLNNEAASRRAVPCKFPELSRTK